MTSSTTNMTSPATELGNLVRLIPLTTDDLPAHPALEAAKPTGAQNGAATSRPSLSAFVTAILTEATRFIDTTVPTTFQSSGTKSAPPATSSIQILKQSYTPSQISAIPFSTAPIKRNLSPDILQGQHGESWFVRKSVHENEKAEGTADWEEMDEGLRVEHNEHERDYTPDIFDTYKVLDWDAETLAMGNLDNFSDIRMRIYEMCHKLPFPLTTRVFPVLVVTALTGTNEGIDVQIPIDIRNLPAAFYSNGRNLTEGDSALKKKKPVLAVYTSVERIRLLPDNKIEWIMGTASDAKGVLPMPIQKSALPGAIAKDVGLFMKWMSEKRKTSQK